MAFHAEHVSFSANLISLCGIALNSLLYTSKLNPAVPTRVNFLSILSHFLLCICLYLVKIFLAALDSLSAFISSYVRTFPVQIKCRLVFHVVL